VIFRPQTRIIKEERFLRKARKAECRPAPAHSTTLLSKSATRGRQEESNWHKKVMPYFSLSHSGFQQKGGHLSTYFHMNVPLRRLISFVCKQNYSILAFRLVKKNPRYHLFKYPYLPHTFRFSFHGSN